MTERQRQRYAQKLHPTKIRTSGMFTAILACLLRETWTSPGIAELLITSDGMLLARDEGDCGFNNFIGPASSLRRNLEGVCAMGKVSPTALLKVAGL